MRKTILFGGTNKERLVSVASAQSLHSALPEADLWFWDAPGGGNTFPDPVSKNPNQTGARVADLETVVSYYMTSGGEVAMWWRQLQPAVTPTQQANLMTFVGLADGTPFPGTNFKLPAPWNLGVGFAASWALGTTVHATIAGDPASTGVGVELQPRLAALATRGRDENGWQQRLEVVNGDVKAVRRRQRLKGLEGRFTAAQIVVGQRPHQGGDCL